MFSSPSQRACLPAADTEVQASADPQMAGAVVAQVSADVVSGYAQRDVVEHMEVHPPSPAHGKTRLAALEAWCRRGPIDQFSGFHSYGGSPKKGPGKGLQPSALTHRHLRPAHKGVEPNAIAQNVRNARCLQQSKVPCVVVAAEIKDATQPVICIFLQGGVPAAQIHVRPQLQGREAQNL